MFWRRLCQPHQTKDFGLTFVERDGDRSFGKIYSKSTHQHRGDYANNASPSCYLRPSQSALLKSNLFDVLFDEPIIDIAARDVAALKAANACPATGSALNEFEANRCRGESFQFGALLGRQTHFLAFGLAVDGDANAIMVSLRIASDLTGMSS
jgi:hypothetical protein